MLLVLACALCVGVLPGESAFLEGDAALRRNAPRDAAIAFRAAAERDPALKYYAELRIGDAFAASKDLAAARGAYGRVLKAEHGPWIRKAHARLAALDFAAKRFDDAAMHYRAVFDAPLIPWAFQSFQADAAACLAARGDTAAQGYSLYRDLTERSGTPQGRIAAAQAMFASPRAEDRMAALAMLLRAGGPEDACAGLEHYATPLVNHSGVPFSADQVAGWTVRTPGEEKLLETICADNAKNPWLRHWLAYAALAHAATQADAFGVPWCRALARHCPNAAETGDALWRTGDRLAAKGEAALAEEMFALLAQACPAHARVPGALLRIAQYRLAGKDYQGAKAACLAVSDRYPNSLSVSEARYRASFIAREQGLAMSADELLRLAGGSVGQYFAHRALDAIPEARRFNFKLDGAHAILQPAAGFNTPVPPLPSAVENDLRVQRLRFFGANGLEEGEWEALEFCMGFDAIADPAPYYRAAAEAGFAYAAERYAELRGWGRTPSGPTLERRRLSYPLAYWPIVSQQARAAGVDPFLVLAVARQESTYRAGIVSRSGAVGVMQLMPGTAQWMGKTNPAISPALATSLGSPLSSIRLGAFYLRHVIDGARGNIADAVAAYNGGPGNVKKWKARFGALPFDEYIDAIPYTETRDYVRKVLANYMAHHSLYPASQ